MCRVAPLLKLDLIFTRPQLTPSCHIVQLKAHSQAVCAYGIYLANNQICGFQYAPIAKEHAATITWIRQHIFFRHRIELTTPRQIKSYDVSRIGQITQFRRIRSGCRINSKRYNGDANRLINATINDDCVERVSPMNLSRE